MASKPFFAEELGCEFLPESLSFLPQPLEVYSDERSKDFVLATSEFVRDGQPVVMCAASVQVEHSPMALELDRYNAKNPNDQAPDFASTTVRGRILGETVSECEVMVGGTRSRKAVVAFARAARHIVKLVESSQAKIIPAEQMPDFYELSEEDGIIYAASKQALATNK